MIIICSYHIRDSTVKYAIAIGGIRTNSLEKGSIGIEDSLYNRIKTSIVKSMQMPIDVRAISISEILCVNTLTVFVCDWCHLALIYSSFHISFRTACKCNIAEESKHMLMHSCIQYRYENGCPAFRVPALYVCPVQPVTHSVTEYLAIENHWTYLRHSSYCSCVCVCFGALSPMHHPVTPP